MLGGQTASIASLPLVLLRLLMLNALGDRAPYQFKDAQSTRRSYDFVVVGAGAGGSVVSARLAEAGATVLLLEAGLPATPETAIPGLHLLIFFDSNTWKIKQERTQGTFGAHKGEALVNNVGKLMGGSTSLNFMLYLRGSRHDYDNWARLGNEGWSYKSVLPYFKRIEDYRGIQTNLTERFSGQGGPVTIEANKANTPLNRAFFRAGRELGYDLLDSNGPRDIGFSPTLVVTRDGLRVSASEAYLRPNAYRSNLHIRTGALATKIIFDANKRAVGVQYRYKNSTHMARVTKEVIVSASAVFSPKLLMMSGVGPKAHLQEMGIPVVAAVEGVGRNLQRHPSIKTIPWAVRRGVAFSPAEVINPAALVQAVKHRTGILSTVLTYVGTCEVHLGEGNPDWPDVQVSMSPFTQSLDGGIATRAESYFKPQAYDDIYGPTIGHDAVSMNLALSRPKTRGWVRLNSSHPEDMPRVRYNSMEHPQDFATLLKGIKFLFKLANTTAMRDGLQMRYLSKPLRYCSHYPHLSDAYWGCYVRHTEKDSDYSGSCKMAPPSDPMGVVSPRLRLRGVEGVRVVDSSVLPEIVTNNIMATVLMIGEKGADMIKEDWGYPRDPLTL